MTKDNLSRRVAEEHSYLGLHPQLVSRVIDAVNEEIMKELSRGGHVNMNGFGKFFPKPMKEKLGWSNLGNPAARQQMKIPARIRPSFVASDAFHKSVNGLRPKEEWPENEFREQHAEPSAASDPC